MSKKKKGKNCLLILRNVDSFLLIFLSPQKKLFIEQCAILMHWTPEIIFTPKRKRSGMHRVLQRAWRHIQLDKCVGSLIRTEQCKHHLSDFNVINTSTPVRGRACLSAEGSAARWRRCTKSVLQPITLACAENKEAEVKKGCFKNNEKCPLKLLSVLFARSWWTSVALLPILDYVLTNQHSADAYIICF